MRFELNAPRGAAAARWSDPTSWSVIALFGAALAWVAFRLHVVGDYSTESDFYGGYAEGARLIQGGHLDPRRYAVAGPGYEAALALVGFAIRDQFTAARLISVASAIATLVCWRAILRRRAGADFALWTTVFLCANSVFFRYGYSATTDMLALALQGAALCAVLAADRKFAPFGAGMLAALATLTRYNSVFLVPAALACYAWLAPPPGLSRRRAAALYLAGFALIAAPWAAFSIAAGHLPGESLFAHFSSFYLVDDASRNVQDQFPAFAESLTAARSLSRVAGHGTGAFALKLLARIPDHLRLDGLALLGFPVMCACLVGLLLALCDGAWRKLLPVWAAGALLFATLVPVFYSDRYSMALAPMYLTLAAAAVCSPLLAGRIQPTGVRLKWIVALVPIVLSVRASVGDQRVVLGNQPVEVIAAGRALARVSGPEDRVMSRKGQIGFYARREVIPFPRLATLAELGDYSRRMRVHYFYYSWYEAMIRAEFAYLLDTTATVPGLTVLHSSPGNPAVLYRVGPDFGRVPDWMARRKQLDLHRARAYVRYLPAAQAAASHVVLAADALDHDDPAAALEHINRAAEGGPLSQVALRLSGHALRLTGRPAEAIPAYESAIVMDRNDVEARLGLGWAQLGMGNLDRAARAWSLAIGARSDSFTLEEMARLYDRLGRSRDAAAARTELAGRTAGK